MVGLQSKIADTFRSYPNFELPALEILIQKTRHESMDIEKFWDRPNSANPFKSWCDIS